MAKLRSPTGCPWDREQTHRTLVPYLIEESFELAEAIEQDDDREICEELGDVLLQIVFHSQLATERGKFSVADVIDGLANKMVRRHPHVFGDTAVSGVDDVWKNWDQLKATEASAAKRPSKLDGVPKGLGALQRSQKMQDKAARVGFDWPDIAGVADKLVEELRELAEARADAKGPASEDAHVREEFGDVLFTIVNFARRLGLDAESALREATEKFYRRFTLMEGEALRAGRDLREMSPAELDALWMHAKAAHAELASEAAPR
jgi:tetrapyrrole methylase family protein/MazG family protein